MFCFQLFYSDILNIYLHNFSGHVTDLNMWSSALSDEEMKNITTCKPINPPPDYLDWSTAQWELGEDSQLVSYKILNIININFYLTLE